jgi:hypothetical protein
MTVLSFAASIDLVNLSLKKWYTSEFEFSVVEKGEETHEF